MADLTVDSQYPGSYSEYSSTNSSFSSGLPTPTSSAEFSAATSRRQSIASEVQSRSESAFDRFPSFSRDGVTTPIETPLPFRLTIRTETSPSIKQGYETECSPIGIQGRSRSGTSSASEDIRLQDPLASRGPYFHATASPELDVGVRYSWHQDDCAGISSKPRGKPLMEWSGFFGNSFDPDYIDFEPAWATEALGLDPSAKFDLGYDHPEFLTGSAYLGNGIVNAAAAEANSPQTVSPQETFVCPSTAFMPTTPTSQHLEPAFRTPVIKSEDQRHDPFADNTSSPCDSIPNGDFPIRRGSSIQEWRQTIDALTPRPSSTESMSSKRRRLSIDLSPHHNPPVITWIKSSNKKHKCHECDKKFDRPEHYKRHEHSEQHYNRLVELGRPVELNFDTKPWKCAVPGCKTAVTRKDNLKAHYQKTHFFKKPTRKDGKDVEVKKRNLYVSPEEADDLGLGYLDPRTSCGREQMKSCKTPKLEPAE
ncbi:MAG: hypothetical protein LQ338_007445 [Usnochroma carphineum]|nr:MAG: hypothetical protein LQ338_007445 [Usnochroma carphineum]